MSLRVVKAGTARAARAGEGCAAAFLVVTGGGAVCTSLGWDTLSADPAPRRIDPGGGDDPILRGIGEAVAEARETGRPAARSVEVSLQRIHLYAITAAPLPGKGKRGDVAVAVQEAPAPEAATVEGKVIRQLGHNLRTPLTSISGAVELIQSGRLGSLQPQQERVLGMMQKGVDAMVRLIDGATTPFRKDIANDLGLAELEDLAEECAEPSARPKRGRR